MRPMGSLFRLPTKLRRKARRSRINLMILLLATICLLPLPFYFIYRPPGLLIQYFSHRWPDVLWAVQTTRPVIALTIDDAPSEYTDEINQLLKVNDASATFFVVGSQIDGRQRELQDLVRGGNELGNHAMYDEPARSLSDEVLQEQITSVQEKINAAYAEVELDAPPPLFRPGSGFFSTRMRNLVTRLGYRLVLGSIYPHDPQIPYWRVNAHHILGMARPGGIIICHDRRSWTVPMLRKVLPELKRKGYRIVTVTQLLHEREQG